ncbi:MAG: MoaD/ThiS family protein [Methanobacteriaceae archaeon]|jgi:sulfur carrier protein|uniref:MoaD/ThiS family protein n=1 Tax=Methanobrevibacter TaxID=2172 RepID=UPI002A1538CD|nr:MoaD/ThiS family protein [Methanobacteriaceae archaeon]MDD3408468.1 MoaD/ThiS family protein [Methanobacteriaceae archaeon]MDD4593614.1 MoaD/ThiS family protein [Methanobacteriaceae archaeon]
MTFKLEYNEINEDKELNGKTTILNVLDDLEVSPQTIVAKKNDQIVSEDAEINDGDTIKLIQIIYGG